MQSSKKTAGSKHLILAAAALSALGAIGTRSAGAATLYWDGVSSGWNLPASWSTASGATTPDPATVPGIGDDAIFNIAGANANQIISLNANQAANSLTFNSTGTTLIQGNTAASANRILTLGAGGITLNAGAGAVTIGSTTANQAASITVGASQSWINNSASTLTIVNAVTGAANARQTLTIGGTGNTTWDPGSFINASSGGVLNLTKSGTGTLTLGVTASGTANNLGHGILNVTGGTINLGGRDLIVGGLTGSGIVKNGPNGAKWFWVQNGADNLFSGIIEDGGAAGASALGLNKSGAGTLSLTGNVTYSDRTTISGGTIEYGSSTSTGVARSVSDNAGTGLHFNAGEGAVKSSSDGTGTASLTFGGANFVRTAGATANFIVSGGTNGTSNSINIPRVAGFIDHGSFFNGSEYAWVNADNSFVRGIAYNGTEGVTSGSTATLASATHQEFTGDITAQDTATFTTLRNSGNHAFTLNGGATVSTNGILKAGNVAGGATISGGAGIQAATLNGELIVRTDGANDALTISTPVLANGTSSLVKSGAGSLTLSGASTYTGNTTVLNGTLNVTGSLSTGAVQASGGTLNLSGTLGTTTSGNGWRVGTIAATPAVMNVLPGASASRNNLFVGDNGAGAGGGAVYQSGGTIALTQGAGVDNLRIGSNAGGYGYYNLSNGSLTTNRAAIGANLSDTIGVVDMTGGTFAANERYELASGGGSSSGLFNVTGGAATSANDIRMLNGGGNGTAIAVLNVGGGSNPATVTTGNAAGVGVNLAQGNNSVGALGVANLLPNGTLTTGRILGSTQANATTHLNFNGGTLKATAVNNGASFFGDAGPDAINVYSGGGTIDNSGTNITVQALRAPAGSGVSAATVSVASGGSGYVGAPLVKLTGGSGSGATGYAVMNNGVVSSVVITSPGIGYLPGETLTANFYGGGAKTPAPAVTGIAVAANTSGGMTFTGSAAGTTTLSGVNTYTGATNITGGGVRLTGAASLNNSSGITVNGGKFVQTSSVAVSPAVTLTNGTVDGTGTINSLTVANAAGNTIANGAGTTGALTVGSLTLNGAATLNLTTGSTAPVLNTTTLTANGAAGSVVVNASSIWSTGSVYNLIGYTGGIGGTGFSAFTKGTISGLSSRQFAELTNPAGFIALSITGDTPVWTGLVNGNWTTNTITPDGSGNKNWKLAGAGTATDFLVNDQVRFDDTAGGTTTVSISDADVATSGVIYNNSTKDYTINGPFGISSGTLLKNGTGAVTINTSNSFTGGTIVNAGTVNAGATSALGNGALTVANGTVNLNAASAVGGGGAITLTSGALNVTAASGLGTGALTVNGGTATLGAASTSAAGVTLNGGTINLNDASGLGTGPVTIAGGTIDNTSGAPVTSATNNAQSWTGDFTFTGTSDLNLGTGSVTLAGTGVRTVTVANGTLTTGRITGPNPHPGLTKAGAGTLTIQPAVTNNTQTSVINGTVTVAAGRLNIGANDFVTNAIAGSGTIANGSDITRWLFIFDNGADSSFAGSLVNGTGLGALGLNKNGAGTMTLTGTHDYTSTTTITGGTLKLLGANTGAGTAVNMTAGTLVLGSTTSLGAASTITAGNNSTLVYATDGGDTVYNTNFGTTTNFNIVSDRATPGAGVNHPMGNSTYGGGTVNITSGANVTSGTASVSYGDVILSAGSAQTTTFNPTTATVTIGSVAGISTNTLTHTLGLGGTSTGNAVTGVIANGGPAGEGLTAVNKTGTSTWTLNGANTYTGGTTLTGGTLSVGSDANLGAAAGPVTFNGGTLQVTGSA
ncbi:MAG TPA: autotransporter-associated beta strand repeat-containing protein, partial [Tepidisphaeraceae bacterium]|nr:autotransporter-associated beta strand repeat-containing protein [Tepidisphaeraceae bacterium]